MLKNTLTILIASLIFLGCSSDSDSTSQTQTPDVECTTELSSMANKNSRPMLVVLVNYNDINITSTESVWQNKIFGTNEGELNHYYGEISNGLFEFTPLTDLNGTVSVHLDKNHPNKNIDDSDFSSVVYPDLKASLEAVNAENNVSFADYDTDGDGHITPDELLVTFIIAGYEDAYQGHVEKGIWAHQSCVSSTNTPTLDGVTIMGCIDDGNFALFGERHDTNVSKTHDATIGVIAHELGHSAFELPDLYNTVYSSGGIGVFGLMGAGTWTAKDASESAGATPVHMSAWSKFFVGWLTPDETSGSKIMNATSSANYNSVKIPINSCEYYLLENRNNTGYDRGLNYLSNFNGGLSIWHIDETRLTPSTLFYNQVNAYTSNKGVDLVEAANANIDQGGNGDEKNLFYLENVSNYSGAGVTNISSRGETMGLDVN